MPDGRLVTEKVPLSDEVVDRSTPVDSLWTVSFAFGTADPDGSLIVPVIVDKSDWAKTMTGNSRHTAAVSFTQTERINSPFMSIPKHAALAVYRMEHGKARVAGVVGRLGSSLGGVAGGEWRGVLSSAIL